MTRRAVNAGGREKTGATIGAVTPAASLEEGAAIAAAVERFSADTAPAPTAERHQANRWQRAALSEGVEHGPNADVWGGKLT